MEYESEYEEEETGVGGGQLGSAEIAHGPGAEAGAGRFLQLESETSRAERLALCTVRCLRRSARVVLMVLGDFAALIAATQAALLVQWLINPAYAVPEIFSVLCIYCGTLILSYLAFGLYSGMGRSGPDELRRLTLATITLTLIALAGTYVFRERFDIGATVFLLTSGFALFTVPLARGLVRSVFARRKWWGQRAIILGRDMRTAFRLVRALRSQPRLEIKPAAIATTEAGGADARNLGLPLIRGAGSVVAEAKARGIDYAIVTMSDLNDPDGIELIRRYETNFKHWLIVPYFAQSYSLWVRTRDLNGMLGLELTHRLLSPWDRFFKRIIDLALTLLGGIVAFPACLLIGLLLKLDSPGPVLYSQVRLGKNGKPFRAYKFRTMIRDADAKIQDCLDAHPELRDEWEAHQKLQEDPRVTRVGRFLRKTSFDELPQLINVLRGEMSLVGPRPCTPDQVSYYGWVWDLYQRVSPGITGQWQVSGRNAVSFKQRTLMDAYYIRNWSIWLDIYILALTVRVVLKRDGAY